MAIQYPYKTYHVCRPVRYPLLCWWWAYGDPGLRWSDSQFCKAAPPTSWPTGQTSDILTVDKFQHPTMRFEMFWLNKRGLLLREDKLIAQIIYFEKKWGVVKNQYHKSAGSRTCLKLNWVDFKGSLKPSDRNYLKHVSLLPLPQIQNLNNIFFSNMTFFKSNGLMVIISARQSLTLKNVGLFVVGEGRHTF